MSSAIVTGATGILGRQIVLQLSKRPDQWNEIYATSRSKTEEWPSNVSSAQVDLLLSPEAIAESLAGIQAEYVFYAAYLQNQDEQEQTKINGAMLENFLKALQFSHSLPKLKRIVLVTGAKHYGVHLGAVKLPMQESDPWLPEGDLFPSNFYYEQQRSLVDFCDKHGKQWTVTYPSDVIGFAKGNFMNLASAIAIYAAVHKELGHPALPFPGSDVLYMGLTQFTDARLHAEFCVWAALNPQAGNEAFNVYNGDTESWQNPWPRIARRFGMKVPADQFLASSSSSTEVLLTKESPLSVSAEELGIRGMTSQGKIVQHVDLVQWAQKPEVQAAWARLAAREGLNAEALKHATWAFMGFVVGRTHNLILSMSKARKAGWTGYRDTWESFETVFADLEKGSLLPPTKGTKGDSYSAE